MSTDDRRAGDPTGDPTGEPIDNPVMPAPTDPTLETRPTMNDQSTTPLPVSPAPTPFRVEPATPVPDDVVAPRRSREPAPQPLVTVAKGPRRGTVLLGLASLLVAAYVIVGNLTSIDLDLRTAGPFVFGAAGALLVAVGLVGVLAGRRR